MGLMGKLPQLLTVQTQPTPYSSLAGFGQAGVEGKAAAVKKTALDKNRQVLSKLLEPTVCMGDRTVIALVAATLQFLRNMLCHEKRGDTVSYFI
jgi:hypothetical protein